MADLIVAGAGMAGLVAAAEARALGASVRLVEKGDRPGGSMRLSSGVIWRYRDFDRFRVECPDGDEGLQRLVFERLDGDLAWLEALGASVAERGTGNALTSGARFDPASLTDSLARAAGKVELGDPLLSLPTGGTPIVLATGGFQASRALVREHITPQADRLLLRAAPWSSGDGLRMALAAGASPSSGLGEFYGRNMPAPPAVVKENDFVSLAQLYARHARVTNTDGVPYEVRTWSETDVVQWTARQPGARARYTVGRDALDERLRERTVGEMIAAARAAGAEVVEAKDSITVEVIAGITTTLGGIGVDRRAQAAEGVFACGADVGGIATGGYASGLAAALVLGRIAARSALGG